MTSSIQTTSDWHAELTLGFINQRQRTVLATRRQRGPLAVQRSFYPEVPTETTQACHTYVLHPPGGVVGGDQLRIDVNVETNAHAVLTTPGATKFYRSVSKFSSQYQFFKVNGGCLEWLPQENIFFPHTHSALHTSICLDATAQYIGWEIHCLGRPAIQETFLNGNVEFKTALYRAQQPVLLDKFSIRGVQDLSCALRGLPVVATFLATPAHTQILEQVRAECERLPITAYVGATLFNGVLIVRALGESTEEIMQLYRRLWQIVRPLVVGVPATPPRIWAC
jgi:urease accessory protein